MEKTVYSQIIDGFEIFLSRTDSGVTIDAEHFERCECFRAQISSDSVLSLTSNIFLDLEGLYDGLTEAISGSDNNTRLSITKDAKLTFEHKTFIGKKERTFKFTIQLEEVKVTEIEKLERQLSKAYKRMSEYEERLKKYERSHKEDYFHIKPTFDSVSSGKSYFTFSNHSSTMKIRGGNHANWFGIPANEALPEKGKYKFSVRIDSCINANPPYVLIGLVPEASRDSVNLNSGGGVYLYSLQTGGISSNGTSFSGCPNYVLSPGDVVSVYVDVDGKELFFDMGGHQVMRTKIADRKDLYPFVSLYFNNDTVSFV